MSDFKVGDRVDIEFTASGVVSYVYHSEPVLDVRLDDGTVVGVPVAFVSRARPALPPKEGSVIKITRWWGTGANWTALLTPNGWRISADSGEVYYTEKTFEEEGGDWDFEVLYVHEN